MLKKRLFSAKTVVAIITAVVATVAGAWGKHLIGPRPAPPSQHASIQTGELERRSALVAQLAESRVSFADWQALLKQSLNADQRKAIFERYRGERVTWQGYVSGVNRIADRYSTSSEQFIVAIYEDRETLNSQSLGRAPALFIFPRGAEDELSNVSYGQHIVLQGTFADPSLHGHRLGTRLYNCELLGVADSKIR